MPLAPGTVIGAFEVRELLGAGGMGEVYRARDPKLGRDVAVKVLPSSLALDPDRLARFRREAQVLATLNHPRIGAIHGVEDGAAGSALVLELVEGPTLAERIARGAVPLPEALGIGRQIVEALEAAHAHGIVHRDLKPANIKLRPDGAVKVLDFGLAKTLMPNSVEPGPAGAPTITFDGTRTGVVVGTPAYMSPEQVRGQAVDERTDIWAFGCVLYEMLTGRRAFSGATSSDAIAAVLERDPDWRALPDSTPASVRRLLHRCLAKDPHRRLRHIADAGLEIEDALQPAPSSPEERAAGVAAAPRSRRRVHLAWGALAAVLTAVAVALVLDRRAVPEAPRVVTLSVNPPAGTTFPRGSGAPWPSVSPDGRLLAFVAIARGGQQRLWVRRLDSTAVRALDGTDGAARPFWSPDSRSLGYFANGQLARVDVDTGDVRVLTDAAYLGGLAGTWGDGVIVWKGVGGFYSVAAGGGPAKLVWPNPDGFNPVVPGFLPDGRRFVYTQLSPKAEASRVCVGSIDSADTRCFLGADAQVRYAAPGVLLRLQDSRLVAQRFDPDRLETSGEPSTIVAERFSPFGDYPPPPFSASDGGVLAYSVGPGPAVLTWVDRSGTPQGPPFGEGVTAALSPDERQLVVGRRDAQSDNLDLWLVDMERKSETRFTFGRGGEAAPAYSPDGARIVYIAGTADATQLYTKRTDGTGAEEALGIRGGSPHWSPDGRHILYQTRDANLNFDLWAAPLAGGQPIPVARTEHGERAGRFSPDSRWVAYDSTESGRREIWIQPFPPTGSRWQVSTAGGATPEWRGDGRELFYVAADGAMMAVPITTGATPTWGQAQALFTTMFAGGTYGEFLVTGDGQRFLLPVPPALEDVTPITVVVNWTAALPR